MKKILPVVLGIIVLAVLVVGGWLIHRQEQLGAPPWPDPTAGWNWSVLMWRHCIRGG